MYLIETRSYLDKNEQIVLGVGSWTSNLTNAGSISSILLLLKNVYVPLNSHFLNHEHNIVTSDKVIST